MYKKRWLDNLKIQMILTKTKEASIRKLEVMYFFRNIFARQNLIMLSEGRPEKTRVKF